MASNLRPEKIVGLFNCDNLYDLNIVETLLRQVEPDLRFTLSVHHNVFRLPEMKKLSEEVPEMDYAVFVVHANESRLSINEKDAGIGYAKLFKALKENTGDKVLVVIGGDSYYKGEENQVVLSNWAKYKISSQFSEEYLDGRKSFVFSWYNKPNPIHYPALIHFFNNQGQVFEVPQEIQDLELRRQQEEDDRRKGNDRESWNIDIPVSPRASSPLSSVQTESRHYLIKDGKIMYKSDDAWEIDEQILQDALNTNIMNKENVLLSISGGTSTSRKMSAETVFHQGWWYYYPLPLNKFIYSLKPSGDVQMTSLLLEARIVKPSNTWRVPDDVERNLVKLYKDIPLACVEICYSTEDGVSSTVYYPEETNVDFFFRWIESSRVHLNYLSGRAVS